MSDKNQGLYDKFERPIRKDGQSAPGKRHHNCRYFILDLDHDQHAIAALEAYANSCMFDYPHLAHDLLEAVDAARERGRLAT